MAEKEKGFWRGFVWGIFTPAIAGLGLTALATVAAVIVGRSKAPLDGD